MVCRFPACPKKPKRLWVLRLPGFDSFFSHGCSEKMRNPTISSDLFLSLINPHDDTLRHEKCRANMDADRVPDQGQAHDSGRKRNRKMAFFKSLNTLRIPLGLVVHKGYSYAVSQISYGRVFCDNLEIDSQINGRLHLHAKKNGAWRIEVKRVRCKSSGRSLVSSWH